MLDIPEALIILLSALVIVLWMRHWISTIALDKARTENKGKVG